MGLAPDRGGAPGLVINSRPTRLSPWYCARIRSKNEAGSYFES